MAEKRLDDLFYDTLKDLYFADRRGPAAGDGFPFSRGGDPK